MAHPEHLAILKRSVTKWNEWRMENPDARPNLSHADLIRADLCGADLVSADLNWANLLEAKLMDAALTGAKFVESSLEGADLSRAKLIQADLIGTNLKRSTLVDADLTGATLLEANLHGANLTGATLIGANLHGAYFYYADLTRAKCHNANFSNALLVGTKLQNTDLTGARVHGVSAWDIQLDDTTIQKDLVITMPKSPSGAITVDNMEVAQFIYLLLHSTRVRKVIDTITSKVVLILGSFTSERKAVLEALREELRSRDYVPVLFDFEKPTNQTRIETIFTLAGMARFVIADLTDAKSILQELQAIVPSYPSLPVKPILLAGQAEPGMFDHLKRFPWVLDPRYYDTLDELMANLTQWVIGPAELHVAALRGRS